MIRYSLRCAEGHPFDGWFASSGAFDTQRDGGLLSCPFCGTADVDRALMAPAVVAREKAGRRRDPSGDDRSEVEAAGEDRPEGKAPPPAAEPPGEPAPVEAAEILPPGALRSEQMGRLRAALTELHQMVRANATDVGREFPEKARAMHYGETAPAGIYGQADADEARELLEEGIDIMPLPPLPDDRN